MDAVFHSQLRFHLTESGFHGRRNRRNNFRSSVVRYGAVRLKITRLLESRVSFSFFPFHVPRSFTRVLNTSTWKTSKRRRRFGFGFANFEFVGHTTDPVSRKIASVCC